VLSKPCEPARLLLEIQSVLERSRSLRQHSDALRRRADAVQSRALDICFKSLAQHARFDALMDRFKLNDIAERVRGEFLDIPGLRLTLGQAARLWDVDREACSRVLDALVDEGFLTCRVGRYSMVARRLFT
jgi:hypothetical protein